MNDKILEYHKDVGQNIKDLTTYIHNCYDSNGLETVDILEINMYIGNIVHNNEAILRASHKDLPSKEFLSVYREVEE